MRQEASAAPVEGPPAEPDALRPDAAAEARSPGRRRRWLWLGVLLAVAVGAAVVLGVGFGRDPRVVESVLLDEPAPPLSGRTLGDGSFDLAGQRGEIVVVNVWASWCTVCKEEHPELEAAARRLAPHGVQFVGLNTLDTVEDARAFLEEMGGSSYPSVRDPNGRKAVDWGGVRGARDVLGGPARAGAGQDRRSRHRGMAGGRGNAAAGRGRTRPVTRSVAGPTAIAPAA